VNGIAPGGGPLSERSVRAARPEDVDAVGAVQSAVWRQAYAGRLPKEVLAGFDAAVFADRWRQSLQSPPPGVYRLLVALAGGRIVGYAAIAPSQDPDLGSTAGEVTTLGVAPTDRALGHGSRLLNACVDLLSEAGAELVAAWLPADEERTRAFLHAGGFAPDGAFRDRVVAPDGGTLREVRLLVATAASPVAERGGDEGAPSDPRGAPGPDT
jgi:ribosomal protein S18 acetylase RimI-like enzyme